MSIYRVVIESSNGQEKYTREYIGPAASVDDALRQAHTVFDEEPNERLVTVEAVDRGPWDEDAIIPPDGAVDAVEITS